MSNALFLNAALRLAPESRHRRVHASQRRLVDVAGALQLLLLVVHTLASYVLAAMPFGGTGRIYKVRFHRRLLDGVMGELPAPAGVAVQSLQALLEAPADYFVTIIAQQALLTIIPLGLMLALLFAPHVDREVPRRVLHWALAFGGVAVFAAPYITGDFWLSLAWGRTLAQGLNPYYEVAANAALGLPHPPPMRATYGPLWLVNIGFISWLTGGGLWTAIPLKLQLFFTYAALLLVVSRLLREQPARDQGLGLLCLGWLPLGFIQLVSEGHNDGVMCALVMVWLYLLSRGRPYSAAAALACAALVKFAAAALFLAHVLYALPRTRSEVRAWVSRGLTSAAIAVSLALLFLAPFYRDVHMVDSLAAAQSYEFYLPRDLYFWFVIHLYAPPYAHLGARVVDYALLVVAALALVRHVQKPSWDSFLSVALALMSALLICFGGHVWPWYLMWLLPLAVLNMRGWLSRWVVGLVVAAPFPILVWNGLGHLPDRARIHEPSAAMYAFALGWVLLAGPALRALRPKLEPMGSAEVPLDVRRRKTTA